MSDALWSGRRFRTFNVMDDFNRAALEIEVDTSLPAARVIQVLQRCIELHGKPNIVRLDNGPEFISSRLAHWAGQQAITLQFIQPGKPTQNAYIERFNRSYRNKVLDCYVFESLEEVREITEDWRQRYNQQRPHDALNKLPPETYAKQHLKTLKLQ